MNEAVRCFLSAEIYAICGKNKIRIIRYKLPVLELNSAGVLDRDVCTVHFDVNKRYLIGIADSIIKLAEIQTALGVWFIFLQQ